MYTQSVKSGKDVLAVELHGHSAHSMFLPTSIQSHAYSASGNACNCH